jgi:hypothetical protein
MLAMTMLRQWSTLSQIAAALKSNEGLKLTQAEVMMSLRKLENGGTYTLAIRRCADSSQKEFRLHVKPEAVEMGHKYYKPFTMKTQARLPEAR